MDIRHRAQVVFGPQSRWAAIFDEHGVAVFDTETWRLTQRLERTVGRVVFGDDGQDIFFNDEQGTLYRHNLAQAEIEQQVADVGPFEYVPGTKLLVNVGASGVEVRDASSLAVIANLSSVKLTGLYPLAHGQVISTHSLDGHTCWIRWDLQTRQSLAMGTARYTPKFAHAPLGDWLAVTGFDESKEEQFVEVWQGATRVRRMTVPDPETRPLWPPEVGPFPFAAGVMFSLDEKLLGVVTERGNATVWSVPSLRAVGTRNHENIETALPDRILFSSGLPSRRTGLYTVTGNGWSERLENRAWGYSHAEATAFGGVNQPLGQRDDVLLFGALGIIAIDPITGTTRRNYPGAEGDRYHHVWTDPDKRFVLAFSDSRISIWDYATAQPLREIPQGHERIVRLLFDPQGSTLGIVSSDYTRAAARFVGPGRNDTRMLQISRNSGEDLNAEVTPRGLLVAQSGKRALKVTDLVTNKVLLNRRGDFAYGPPAIAPDGASVMARWFERTRSTHKATAFSLDDGSSVFDVDTWGGPDHASPFSPDGHWLARPVYQAKQAAFNAYDWTTKKLLWSEPFGEGLPGVVTLGAHGTLATRDCELVGIDTLIRVSKIVDRRVVATFPRDQKDVVNLAIDDTAGVVAATTKNGHIIVFDMASGAELQRFDTKTELPLPALALSSRGIVAAGNERGQIYLFSIQKHQLVGQVEPATLQNALIVRTPAGQYEILVQDQADGRDVVCRSGNRTEPWARCAHGATPGLLARLLGN